MAIVAGRCGSAVVVAIFLAAHSAWPFDASQTRLPVRPSLWQLLLSDHVTSSKTRAENAITRRPEQPTQPPLLTDDAASIISPVELSPEERARIDAELDQLIKRAAITDKEIDDLIERIARRKKELTRLQRRLLRYC